MTNTPTDIPPNIPTDTSYHSLVGDIGRLLEQGRSQAVKKVNTILVNTY